MRQKRKFLFLILTVGMLSGCGMDAAAPRLENELVFELEGISEITISYDSEAVIVLEGEGDELIVREYMTEGKQPYYARVTQSGTSVHISEGGKPLFQEGFKRWVEVCLPEDYDEVLTLTTTDGDITVETERLSLRTLRIDSTSGQIRTGSITVPELYFSTTSGAVRCDALSGERIRLETTSGTVECGALEGTVEYSTRSGDISVSAASGSGSYQASNSGQLQVVYTQVTGDLFFYNKNDEIELVLPEAASFTFEAATKNGSIFTSFQESLSKTKEALEGSVGETPKVKVSLETVNGDIHVAQGQS